VPGPQPGPHFWLVEPDDDWHPVVHVHELDEARQAYVPTGVHRGRVTVGVPYLIDIDLTGIDHL
jgi:hypothetical protein